MWLVAHVIIKQITIRFGPSVRWSHESYKQMLYQYISIQTAPFYFQSTRICCPYPDRSQGFWIWMLGSSLDLIVEECDKCKYSANKKAGKNHARDVCLVTWFLGKSNENKLMVMKKKKEEEDHYSLQFHSSCFSRENLQITCPKSSYLLVCNANWSVFEGGSIQARRSQQKYFSMVT